MAGDKVVMEAGKSAVQQDNADIAERIRIQQQEERDHNNNEDKPDFSLNDISGMGVEELQALINTLPPQLAELADTLRRFLTKKVEEERAKEIAANDPDSLYSRNHGGKDKDADEDGFGSYAQSYAQSCRQFDDDMAKFDKQADDVLDDFKRGKLSYKDALAKLDDVFSNKWDRMKKDMITLADGTVMVKDENGTWYEVKGDFKNHNLVKATDEDKIKAAQEEEERKKKAGEHVTTVKDVRDNDKTQQDKVNALNATAENTNNQENKNAVGSVTAKDTFTVVDTNGEALLAQINQESAEDDGVNVGSPVRTTSVAKNVLADASKQESSSPKEIGSSFNGVAPAASVPKTEYVATIHQPIVSNTFTS